MSYQVFFDMVIGYLHEYHAPKNSNNKKEVTVSMTSRAVAVVLLVASPQLKETGEGHQS